MKKNNLCSVCAKGDPEREFFFSDHPVDGFEFVEYSTLGEAEVRELFDGWTEIVPDSRSFDEMISEAEKALAEVTK